MQDVFGDLAADLGALALYALGSGLLTLFGLSVEYRSLQSILGGETVLGAWLAVMGGVALVAGATLARRRVLPRLGR